MFRKNNYEMYSRNVFTEKCFKFRNFLFENLAKLSFWNVKKDYEPITCRVLALSQTSSFVQNCCQSITKQYPIETLTNATLPYQNQTQIKSN